MLKNLFKKQDNKTSKQNHIPTYNSYNIKSKSYIQIKRKRCRMQIRIEKDIQAQGLKKMGLEIEGEGKKKQPTREWPAVSLG
ncbi:MAG: hypothetical protein ACI9UO_001955 [Nitrospinales bacterium]|jgi:hypothetical protein